jgi:FixJ family two-component response regulator
VDLSTDAKLSQKHTYCRQAQAFLTKPIDVNELLDLVNAITANARTRSRTQPPKPSHRTSLTAIQQPFPRQLHLSALHNG